MMLDLKLIGRKIRGLRGDASPDRVADELGISRSALFMYERGERMPRDEVKARIADYFGTTVQAIFFEQQEHK